MEIKTLKDLRFNITEKDKDMKELIQIIQEYFHKDLKKEAIKDLRNERVKKMTAIDYILVKFDITEEDLNGNKSCGP